MTAKKSGSMSLNYSGAGARAFDNNDRAAYCILSKRLLVESSTVRQNIHEREDGYRDVQDYADLLQPGVLLFLTWLESCATRSGSNQLIALSGRCYRVVSPIPLL